MPLLPVSGHGPRHELMAVADDLARQIQLHQQNAHVTHAERGGTRDLVDVDGMRPEQRQHPLTLRVAEYRARRRRLGSG